MNERETKAVREPGPQNQTDDWESTDWRWEPSPVESWMESTWFRTWLQLHYGSRDPK